MQTLSKLKLCAFQAQRKSPALSRRNKLTAHIEEQIAMAKAAIDGTFYAAKRKKFVQDAQTGERKQIEVSKRVKPWWHVAPTGKTVLALRYGAKTIEIAKGKNAIELNTADELVSTLEVVKEAVQLGELDTQIELVSVALRAGFGKKTQTKGKA